jgi:hypothetical protein
MAQGRGIMAPPPQARPKTGGGYMAQTPRQAQRQQYLANHPNARGNQPPMGAQIANGSQPPQQRPMQPQGQQLQQMPQQWQPPQQMNPMQMPGRGGGFGGGQQLGQMFGGQYGQPHTMEYRFPQGQQPDMGQMLGGMTQNQQMEKNYAPNQQQQAGNAVLQNQNMQWFKR